MTSIPLVDLRAQHGQVSERVRAGIEDVLRRGSFILGEEVAAFEAAFAKYTGVRHCVGVGSGTDAIELMLRAAGIGSGDEVIVPANSFIATALAVVRAGATPVFADVEARYYLVDSERLATRIGARTRAIIAVHLFGQMAPMSTLDALAREAGVLLFEDAAQAHGARQVGAGPGRFGVAAASSFYPSKNLGACGDGGAVLTNDGDLAQRVRALRNYGSERKYHHPILGFNSRLDTMQAVVLNAKLPLLDEWNAARRQAAARYDRLLERMPNVVRPAVRPENEPVWHLYVVRVPQRDLVLERLTAAGIGAGVHYPVPIHLQGAFRDRGHGVGDFPVTERAAAEILSLPLFPEITLAQQEQVAAELARALAR